MPEDYYATYWSTPNSDTRDKAPYLFLNWNCQDF